MFGPLTKNALFILFVLCMGFKLNLYCVFFFLFFVPLQAEAFCSTYNIDLFVVVYSVVDRASFKAAEKVLQYLKENEMLLTKGAILVGNKTDLERHREVNRQSK